MDDFKNIKRILLIIILIPIIIVAMLYIWFLYQASKLDNYTFTEEMKTELMNAISINESNTFNPIYIQYIDEYGPSYYNAYELKFEISKEDFANNNLSYSEKNEYKSLTDASMSESKNSDTYTCYIKCTKSVNKEKFETFEKIYRQQRHIPLDTNSSETVTNNINTLKDDKTNAQATTNELIEQYNKSVENLDTEYFVTDFETYRPNDKSKNLNEKQISEIAEKGFEESAKRIASEGASNKETETIKLQEIIPNNYFTSKYQERRIIYNDLKMNAYVVTRENEMGCGIKIYIDPSTGLIVGGEAYGD